MSLLRNIRNGLRSLFRKEQVDRELDEELRAYQEMAAEEKMKLGMSRKDALGAVRLERGNPEVTSNLRHSLSSWLVNKAKVEPKTVQGILRHSKIQTTLDLYAQKIATKHARRRANS